MCRTYAVKLFWIFCMNAVPSELMTLLSPGLISPPSDGSSSYAPQQGQHRYAFHLPSLRTYNLGWFGMIYCWFLLLSPSFHQFIGAGKGGISAAAKQPGRCFLKKNLYSCFKLRIRKFPCFNVQGVDVGRDWKLLLLFIQMDQFCACEQQQVEWNSTISSQWWYSKGQFGEKEKLSPVLIER